MRKVEERKEPSWFLSSLQRKKLSVDGPRSMGEEKEVPITRIRSKDQECPCRNFWAWFRGRIDTLYFPFVMEDPWKKNVCTFVEAFTMSLCVATRAFSVSSIERVSLIYRYRCILNQSRTNPEVVPVVSTLYSHSNASSHLSLLIAHVAYTVLRYNDSKLYTGCVHVLRYR